MNGEAIGLLSIYGFFTILLLIAGLFCILMTRNFLRAIIGIEILIKAVTLYFIAVGRITNKTGLAEAMVITIIVIEVVVVVIAGGIALRVFRNNDSLDVRKLRRLKG